jgi:ligand-binding sensor domain-containing protein/serine phosphatase RsbU (regulator of sigma subunit)
MIRITKKYFFLLSLCFLLSNRSAIAQQYNFKNYSAKNGLASSIVNNIFQDSKGYLWLGTQGGGISRFNGKSFTNFNKSNGLISNDVTYISEDKSGDIWIATSDGVSRYDGVKFHNYTDKEGLAKGVVYWIYVDAENKVWFAVKGGGVNYFDGKTFRSITTKDGLSSDNVFNITQDKKGNYWFGLSNGIAMYDGNRVKSYDKVDVVNNKIFFSSLSDSKGNIWFGSAGSGVVKYNGKTFESFVLPDEVKDDLFGSIIEDNKGNIWFATDHGALKYGNKKFHLFNEKQGLSSNGVLSLGNDYEGNVWIGTQGGGLDLFNNESFVNFTDKEGLSSKNISAIYQLSDHDFGVGTTGSGVNFYNSLTNTFSKAENIPGIVSNTIYSFCKDDKGNLLVGAQDGVFVLEQHQEKYKLYKDINKLYNGTIGAIVKIIQDKNKTVWIATYGYGIIKINGTDTTLLNVKNGFISNKILTIYEDIHSNIWIGSQDEGVIKYDGTSFKKYSTKDGLADKAVWSIAGDEKGNIYFGTGEEGVSCFDGKTFKTISSADGLCSNYIPVLLWDKIDNALWVGTEKGINKLKFREKFVPESIRYYGEQQGFKGTEIIQNAVFLDKEGLIWFGTVNGLSRYDRKYDFPNLTPPKLQLTGIRLAYQTVDWKKHADSVNSKTGLPFNLELSHKNNNLTFDFQAFTTDNVKYTFMLEGQNDEWSPLSTNTEAAYTNITPGKNYTFKVKAINSNGVWSKDVVTYTFTINPPWWQTWWFYALCIIIIVAAVLGFINYRTAQLAKEKKVLEEKVTERTLELKGANDKLSVAFQDIKDSINYAKKIQDAILPLETEIKKALPQSFVLFKPRDVVSGDFYWFNKKDDIIYIAAVDCTGHGVPGAFMSMIGSSLLNEIVSKKAIPDPADILKKLHRGVRKALKQDRDSYESKDGMDLALAVVDTAANTLLYAGAKRPLFAFIKNEFIEIKADKQSIGGLEMEDDYHFRNHKFELQKGDTFYLFTDGYVDQFGGEKGKKYSSKRLRENLAEIHSSSMKDQGIQLTDTIDQWKIDTEQIDDILVIGFRF